ncbi:MULTISPECIES: copper chaperone PCu(A)C [Methylobacterium]|uniref:Copper chaperone PCu(A)C n=1 Tax=Methylobacterium thuringiense TaxID=1003091 RepID=A0ABQ4TQ45_9HYPH|nr:MULTISPECIES: copper chaperone PCu(A)C [Methylobacterium]GJE55958.1 hypothetical protein EKPJFOCH_2455 [Methylobacterium thuringiense]
MRAALTTILRTAALAALLGGSSAALAHDYTLGGLKIGHPWSRATPGGAKVAAGYLSVTNAGAETDRLIGGTLENTGRVEVHSMSVEGGVMKMGPVEGGLEVKPGETVTLKPSGYHLMFTGLKAPLKQGEMVKGSLTFEKAGSVPVEFKVEGIAAATSGDEHAGHDHAH